MRRPGGAPGILQSCPMTVLPLRPSPGFRGGSGTLNLAG
jgi:hypothetical protein